jgi:uncharacterized membrane protein
MTPSHFVLLIAFVAFLVGAAGVAVFAPAEEAAQIGVVGWLVRGLVGLAVAHTCVGIYGAIETATDSGDGFSRAGSASYLSGSVMNMMACGGILLGLAALLHLLAARTTNERDR